MSAEFTQQVVRSYSEKLDLRRYQEFMDSDIYDMSQRLRLADIVAKDGHRRAADLGSQWGGMSHALRETGVRTVSTEFLYEYCRDYLRKLDCDVVHCDAFRLPIRNADALVSYMFLGKYLPRECEKGWAIADVFEELSRSSDTIYSVELQSEYSKWFSGKLLEPERILRELETALPDFDVEALGDFGTSSEWPDYEVERRLGFKFTNNNNTQHGRK